MSDIWNKENCLDFCVDPLVHSFGNKKLFIFLFIRYISIPKDFLYWKVKNSVGWSVAHEAVRLKKLPKDFKLWNIKDCTGWSVAHEAAVLGRLPKNFSNWRIRDKAGVTVAQEAEFRRRVLEGCYDPLGRQQH